MKTKNEHRVNRKVWNKWTELQRRIFNNVYNALRQQPEEFLHPCMDKIPTAYWKVIAWNVAKLTAYWVNIKED